MTWPRAYQPVAASCLYLAMVLAPAPPTDAQSKPPVVLDNPVAALSLDQLSATRERPLFSPSRRALRPPIVSNLRPSGLRAPSLPPKIELHGTVIDADETLAIVYSAADNQTLRLHLGDEIGGWKVAVIDERKLVLSLEDRTAEFAIFTGKNSNDTTTSYQEQQHVPRVPLQPRPRASLGPAGVKQP